MTVVTHSKTALILVNILFLTQLLCQNGLKSTWFTGKESSTAENGFISGITGVKSEEHYYKTTTLQQISVHHHRRKYLSSRISYSTGTTSPTFNPVALTKDLLSDGDVSSNPGPSTAIKKTCNSCRRTLAINHRAISCCTCGQWFHIKCARITSKDYNANLANNHLSDWICHQCNLQNLPFVNMSDQSFEQFIQDGSISSITFSSPDYKDKCDLIDDLHVHTEALLIAHLNINSVAGFKLYEVKHWLYSRKIDILILAETKVDETYPDSHFMVQGYQLLRRDKSIHSGGLMIYIKDNISVIRQQHLESSTIQNIAFTIPRMFHHDKQNHNALSKGVIIHGIYRPPSQHRNVWYNEIFNIINSSLNGAEDIIILGDLNCDLMHPDHGDKDGRYLLDLCDVFNLSCLVDKPTRPISNSLLDVILTNDKEIIQKTCILDTDISDHSMIYCLLKFPKTSVSSKIINYRSFKHYDKERFQKDVSMIPSHVADIFDDTDDQMWFLHKLFTETIDEHAPMKSMRVRGKISPYMTPEWRRAKQVKKKLYKDYKKQSTPESFSAYKKQRNICTAIRRKAIRSYFKEKSSKLNGDPRQFWKTFGQMSHSRKRKSNLAEITLNDDGKIITDRTNLCETFNNYFSTITNTLTCPKPPKYLPTLFSHNEYHNHESVQAIRENCKNSNSPSFVFEYVSVSEVSKIIKNLKTSTSPGYDKVQARFLKDSVKIIAPMLSDRINCSIRTGNWPSQFKLGAVTPIYKGGNPNQKENYRPITVLSVFNQIYERAICKRLNEFMSDKLSPYINAYRKHYGCETALVRLIEDWKGNLDRNIKTGIVFNDLSKAFDVIDHNLLLAKLRAYGLSDISLKLIRSYLSDRKQFVKIGNCKSANTEMKVGVPQGSVLGPTFFNIFFNDIFYFIQKCTLTAYADDSQIFAANKELDLIKTDLTFDLSKMKHWFDNNYMQINPSKAKALVLARSNSQVLSIPFDNTIINHIQDEPIKLLGVWLDQNLNFHKHIAEVCKSLSKQLAVLRRIQNIVQLSTKLLLYYTHFLSHLNYCSVVWHFCYKSDAKKLEKVNHRALSFVFNDYKSSYEELLSKNNLFSLEEYRIRNILIYVFKSQTGFAPSIEHLFTNRTTKQNLRGGTKMIIPTAKTTHYGLNSVKYLGAKLWNMLDENIKTAENLNIFKNHLTVNYIKKLMIKL